MADPEPIDRQVLAERAAAVARHLQRVAARLPDHPEDLAPASDASDAVILHLWQATQVVIDLAVSICVRLQLGAPATYAEAFRKLAAAHAIDADLATRLERAAGFRNVVAHAYDSLDLKRVWEAARHGPQDLLAFLRAVERLSRS